MSPPHEQKTTQKEVMIQKYYKGRTCFLLFVAGNKGIRWHVVLKWTVKNYSCNNERHKLKNLTRKLWPS
jgi:hypothetical protein